jgi:hypothetical protein
VRKLPSNLRLKLSGCGGRLKGNGSVLIAAAAYGGMPNASHLS